MSTYRRNSVVDFGNFYSGVTYSWHTKQLTNLTLNLHFDTFFTKVQGVLAYAFLALSVAYSRRYTVAFIPGGAAVVGSIAIVMLLMLRARQQAERTKVTNVQGKLYNVLCTTVNPPILPLNHTPL